MAKKKSDKSTKRFGVRYGPRVKNIVAKLEKTHRGRHLCPYCKKVGVKRVSLGIWACIRCNVKFTGRAYAVRGG